MFEGKVCLERVDPGLGSDGGRMASSSSRLRLGASDRLREFRQIGLGNDFSVATLAQPKAELSLPRLQIGLRNHQLAGNLLRLNFDLSGLYRSAFSGVHSPMEIGGESLGLFVERGQGGHTFLLVY